MNGLPVVFENRMKEMLGDAFGAYLEAFESPEVHALRYNPLKKDGEGKRASEVRPADGWTLTPVPWEPNGFAYGAEDTPGKHPYHEAGIYYIQEPSAMAPVRLLAPQPGERVLDLCAAPGGKTTQIAGLMLGEGILVANEIHPARARILSENLERLGVKNAIVTNEAPERLAERFPGFFDRILVDAPCSGEGMFRRENDALDMWSEDNVRQCAERQEGILDCAARMLRQGGVLVYSTCTFAPAEDEGSIAAFRMRHPEFVVTDTGFLKEKMPAGSCDGHPEWAVSPTGEALAEEAGRDLEKTLRLWPMYVKGEGHFAARLSKGEETPAEDAVKAAPVGGFEPGIPAKGLEDYFAFVQESLDPDCELAREGKNGKRFLLFGENLYRMPEETPSLKGLKVLRPGLQLGTFRKNRFEPAHALALALEPGEVKHVQLLSMEDARRYLSGQTLNAEGEKGWQLLCTGGFSLGWGKLAGGVLKNHYPKGLRKN